MYGQNINSYHVLVTYELRYQFTTRALPTTQWSLQLNKPLINMQRCKIQILLKFNTKQHYISLFRETRPKYVHKVFDMKHAGKKTSVNCYKQIFLHCTVGIGKSVRINLADWTVKKFLACGWFFIIYTCTLISPYVYLTNLSVFLTWIPLLQYIFHDLSQPALLITWDFW